MKRAWARNARIAFSESAREPRRFVRAALRQPLESAAAQAIGRLPRVEVAELVPDGEYRIALAPLTARHAWSLGFAEQVLLELLIPARGVKRAFEIGTFNGGTTRLIAERLPADGQVVTIDLAAEDFTRTQAPAGFGAGDIGAVYRTSPARERIRQERGDSLRFDFTPYFGEFDLVLVDGAHDYEHGFSDSRTALELVRPGGIILWDDFEPYWHGLVRGVLDATTGLRVGKVAGTSFAMLEVAR